MQVKLIAITQPLIRKEEENRFLTAEEFIVYTARVSNPTNQLNTATAPKLLKYCVKHQHWSPFEGASMTVEIKTRRSISQQIVRHRSFSFQEFSQRYSEVVGYEKIELREQAATNRQSSSEVSPKSPELLPRVEEYLDGGMQLYKELITEGIARECARDVLPLATETTLYMTGNVRSWMHYIKIRKKKDTQKEHRLIAEAIRPLFAEHFPVIASVYFNDQAIDKSEKVEVYEKLLHQLDMYFQLGDNKNVAMLLHKISDWSYAHRAGNGELSETQTETLINEKFKKLQTWK